MQVKLNVNIYYQKYNFKNDHFKHYVSIFKQVYNIPLSTIAKVNIIETMMLNDFYVDSTIFFYNK